MPSADVRRISQLTGLDQVLAIYPSLAAGSADGNMEPARGEANPQPYVPCLYLVTRSLDPTGRGKAQWAMRWKPALNAFAITFGDRFPAAETY
jgi:hypothetical protein